MSDTAKSGFIMEDLVVNEFNRWKTSKIANDWIKVMGFNNLQSVDAKTTRSMGINSKADVLVTLDGIDIGISVKKFIASFNQIDKRWIEKYEVLLDMPVNITTTLKKYCGVNGYRPMDLNVFSKDKRRFFLTELSTDERCDLLDFFNDNKEQIANIVFKGEKPPYADYMLVTKPELKNSAIIDIKNVMSYYSGSARITKRGNLKLGKMTVQRKGGNGGGPTAQMLQFKFSPKVIFDVINNRSYQT